MALVEGGKDRFVDIVKEVFTDGDKPAKRYERSNGRKNGR